MIKSAVTINLVPQIKTGPWIFWDNLEESMEKASALGFDAVELFTASGNAIQSEKIKTLLDRCNLKLAAVGTGAGKVINGLTLIDTDSNIRKKAIDFIKEMMAFAAPFGAPDREKYFGSAKRGNEAIPELHFPGVDPKAE